MHTRWQAPEDRDLSMLIESVSRFGKKTLGPMYKEMEEKGEFPAEAVREMAEMGLFGLMISEDHGGFGMGTDAASYVARELAYSWGAAHLIWSANSSLAAFPIMYAGDGEQKERVLPRLASGEILGCYALTEPNAGSDALSMTLRAQRDLVSGDWILNGAKTFITNALRASAMVVFARTGKGKKDISAFLVETSAPRLAYAGVTVNLIEKRVMKSSDFCEVHFKDVRLPSSALLGKEGEGFQIAMKTLDGGRINIAAQALGIAMRIFDEAFKYVHIRNTFGRSVWENQAVQFDFANAYAKLVAAWTLVVEASKQRDRGDDITKIASCTKLFATETAHEVASLLTPYFGGMGFTKDEQHLLRSNDVDVTRVYEGASNIQRMVIAKKLGLMN